MTINTVRHLVPPLLCGFAAILLTVAVTPAQFAEVPYLTGRVTDNAEILSSETRAHLDEAIKAYEAANNDQLAVLTMSSLEGVSIEEFAAQVFQALKLGGRGKGNGVLLLVSPGDRRARIEVGPGWKGVLTDVAAGRIVRDVMAPHFQRGDYNQGIDAGVHAVISQLEGNEPAEPAPATSEPQEKEVFFEGPNLGITERILFGAFIFGIIGLFTAIGVMTPGVGWFLYVFLIPFWAMFPIIVLGTRGALILLIIYLVGYPVAKIVLARAKWYRTAKADLKSRGIAQIGGFTLRSGGASSASWSSS